MKFKFFVPTKIFFGKGQLANLSKRPLPGKKALIVITAGKSVRENGYLARLEEQLDKAGVEHVLFDKILPNPIKTHIEEGAQLARDNGCDFTIGLGGGSSIDAAKAIAVLAPNEGDYWDYVIGGSGKRKKLANKPLPIVAIPTTAGTGSEVDQWAVTTKEGTNEKIGFGNDDTYPTMAIVDPDLMLTVPPRLTAHQGFDALFHSTEGFISSYANFMSDHYALKSIELIAKSLAAAVKDGKDEAARADVALGSTLAGVVEGLSTCAGNHAIEHALSGLYPNLPHGIGLLLMYQAYYSLLIEKHACDEKMILMAKAMGKQNATKPQDFLDALMELQKDCNITDIKMSDYDIDPNKFSEVVESTKKTNGGLLGADPGNLTAEDCLAILQKSYS